MFDKILIANRGEIACRIIETASRLGVRTVAVFSDADRGARHTTLADEAVCIGPAPVNESYLCGDKIIAAAVDCGAQAIHPGYGFLSENPDFVEQVQSAGLVFIGPSADAIRAMGLKDAAKALMESAGVPVVPGYHGADQGEEVLARAANDIGYPVMIKAVAGGGGKGMRVVETKADFTASLNSAKAEALAAFGNDVVLIEKFVSHPRHIEVQIFGDGTDVVHLFERDCSLQRRHQKVIEEAPAPYMNDATRAAMCDAAVRAAKAINYAGAGTVEFIVDGSGPLRPDGFWFMEMNTRLQVEHPVTEAITGIDLVAWQLMVAAGAPLPVAQSDIAINGHAFEARLYAEDVAAGFLPATGFLAHLNFPNDARIDSGVRSGDEISPWYDPMIAKVTTQGADRDIALRKLQMALSKTEVAGTTTNLGFLQDLLADADVVAGQYDTGLIAQRGDGLSQPAHPPDDVIALAAATAAGDGFQHNQAGFAIWGIAHQSFCLRWADQDIEVELAAQGAGRLDVWIDDRKTALRHDGQAWVADRAGSLKAARHAGAVTVFGRHPATFDIPDPLDRAQADQGGHLVAAPMPGLVRHVAVMVGDAVEAGAPLVVLEAMKMEHILKAPRDGVIQSVSAVQGGQVAAGDILVALADNIDLAEN